MSNWRRRHERRVVLERLVMRLMLMVLALMTPISAAAQGRTVQAAQGDRAGHVANSSVGEVGQRQTRDELAPNTAPLGRIATRVQNRVQSRIRNRIDRHYDPHANATSPFEIAAERTRKTAKPSRR